ncbi:hypothetical protein TNCV_3441671 [Trichonephila clavipes]|nr:hypothetical protein TNCV_3441671 [Trichonephila clavipes]
MVSRYSLVTPSISSTNPFTFGLWLCSVWFCSCICVKTTRHDTSFCSENLLWCVSHIAGTKSLLPFQPTSSEPKTKKASSCLIFSDHVRAFILSQNANLPISMKRIYDARSHSIRIFMEITKLLLSELDLPDVDIHKETFWSSNHGIHPVSIISTLTLPRVNLP